MRAALLTDVGMLVLELPLPDDASYRGLQEIFPAAARMQRAAFDLMGARSDDVDARPWLRHAAWSSAKFPLRDGSLERGRLPKRRSIPTTSCASTATACTRYRWARCTPASSSQGISASRSSARKCCDSKSGSATCTRASSGASPSCRRSKAIDLPRGCRAIPRWRFPGPTARRSRESAAAPSRGVPRCLRALCLEIERIQNHLGDLGALGNDAGFAFGLAQFSRLKEELLRDGRGCVRAALSIGHCRAGRNSRRSLRGGGAGARGAGARDRGLGARRCRKSTTSTRVCATDSWARAR